MNNDNTTDTTFRPLGFWLKTVDRLLAREFDRAFEADDLDRRDWRLLTMIDGDRMPAGFADRIRHRGGKRLRALSERGWVTDTDDGWTLTDEGRAAKARLGEIVTGIRQRVAGAVPEDDFATTLRSLEAIARELGWDETAPFDPRERRFGRRGPWERRHGHRHDSESHGHRHAHHHGHHDRRDHDRHATGC